MRRVILGRKQSNCNHSILSLFFLAVSEDVKTEDATEGRLNGEKDTLDETEESRREEKNGCQTRFMFNIADGGFTGEERTVGTDGVAELYEH